MRYKVIFSSFAFISIAASVILIIQFGCKAAASANDPQAAVEPTPGGKKVQTERVVELTEGEFDGKEIVRSNDEWKKELTPDEYAVMREEGTETAYTGALTNNHKHGTYYCNACGLALFSSEAKFESGTGWPSFFQPLFKKNVIEKEDRTLGDVRIKVECARCHAHLGHVFDDGPKPTGLRYCMNSISLRFKANK
jgi:peptide-methionine (R)-S-oxide reductase